VLSGVLKKLLVLKVAVDLSASAMGLVNLFVLITSASISLASFPGYPTSSIWSLLVCKYRGRRPGRSDHVRWC